MSSACLGACWVTVWEPRARDRAHRASLFALWVRLLRACLCRADTVELCSLACWHCWRWQRGESCWGTSEVISTALAMSMALRKPAPLTWAPWRSGVWPRPWPCASKMRLRLPPGAAAELGPLASLLLAPEEGSWGVDEVTVSSSRTGHTDRFVCKEPLGALGAGFLSPVPPGAVVYGSGETAVVLTRVRGPWPGLGFLDLWVLPLGMHPKVAPQSWPAFFQSLPEATSICWAALFKAALAGLFLQLEVDGLLPWLCTRVINLVLQQCQGHWG